MTTNKPTKKGPNRQQIIEQMRKQHVDRQLFTLDYLNQTMNYIMYNNQSLTSYLEIDTSVLDRVISEDVKKVGLHFVQRIKSMKQSCDQKIFLNDLQEYGDFVNYDLPKTYQRDLSLIQAELKQQIQTEMTAKRLKRKISSIGNRMSSKEVQELNKITKEQTLNNLIKNWQMTPEQNQFNLQRNDLYRDLFNIENVMRNQNQDIMLSQYIPFQQGISNKIKITQKFEEKNQITDPNKSKKISKGPKKQQSSYQQPDEYVPKIGKKLKIDQNLMIIPKPALTNPQNLQAKTSKQSTPQSNSVLLGQMAEIDKKSTKYSNNVKIQEANKNTPSLQNHLFQFKKEKISDQQNNVSNTNPQQKIKRKYNRAANQQKVDDSKKTKKVQKEQKDKRQHHRKQRKQEDQQSLKKKKEKKTQSNQAHKIELQPQIMQNEDLANTLTQKNEKIKQVSYVSIAIQTYYKQEKSESKSQIKQQKLDQNKSISIHPQKEKINIFQSIRIQDLKQEKNQVNPNHSLSSQGNLLSLFYIESNAQNVQTLNNAQQNQIRENKQMDIGEFLN